MRSEKKSCRERHATQRRWSLFHIPLAALLRAGGLLFALLAPATAFATDATLIADAHVNSARPSINSGSLSNINVGAGYTGMLQFDLSTLPANTSAAQVSRAILRVYCNRLTTPGIVSVQPLAAAWTEASVTYTTLPPLGTAAQLFPVAQAFSFITVDITLLVQSWITNPATNFGLALSSATAAVQFDSKENDQTAHPAQLDITLASSSGTNPSGAAGATGATGAQGPPGVAGATGQAGTAGVQGIQGAPGPAGLQGPAGATGAAGPTGAGAFVYEGTYSPTQTYLLGQVVTFTGTSYISLQNANRSYLPLTSPLQWGVLASQGSTGLAGAQGGIGPTGPAGPIGAIGLAGPRGLTGLAGPSGPTGSTGSVGPQGLQGVVGLQFQGPYSPTTNYPLGAGVSYEGAGYVSLTTGNHGNPPDQTPSQWALFAAAGATGATGSIGVTGSAGPIGSAGFTGSTGAAGATGATGSQGPPVALYQGNYSSITNYALNDAVSFGGSTYISLVTGNHGNPPDQSPIDWSMLAAQGPAGPIGLAGPTGCTGAAGAAGPTGSIGPAGYTGAAGPPIAFLGPWSNAQAYISGQAVFWNGSSYAALLASSGKTPDQNPAYWSLLAQQGVIGSAGPSGATGSQGLIGIAGPVGPQGLIGSTGAQGGAGPAGPTGLTYRSTYNSTTNYALNDAVSFQGATYISVVSTNSGNIPTESPSFWSLIAAAGSTGPAGQQGFPGVQGQPGVAGPAGSTGSQGTPGVTGQSGPMGTTGPSGTVGATGAIGPEGPAGAIGVAGATGSAGPQGPPITFSGLWSPSSSYQTGAAVAYSGSSYIALSPNSGREPDLTPQFWGLLAQQGGAGPTGPTGNTGPLGLTGAAGTIGAPGLPGQTGAIGPAGTAGVTGAAGPTGSTGSTGSTGTAGLNYQGAYQSATNYALHDAVSFQGSSYISLAAGNHGQTPGSSPLQWNLLAQQGSTGATGSIGATGLSGVAGTAGVAGATGAQGFTGSTGLTGMTYRDAWQQSISYQPNDAVLLNGSTYIALKANSSAEPDLFPAVWAVLAQQGNAGPTGAAATLSIGSVTSTAPGTPATVTNSGSPSAAILNFAIPQGTAGTSTGGTGTGGLPSVSTFHEVSYIYAFYSLYNTTASLTEVASTLTWVPTACTATSLAVFSQQTNNITVTLRLGTPGSMANTELSCLVSANIPCSATGSVAVSAGSFLDLSIIGSNDIPAGVWTALTCS